MKKLDKLFFKIMKFGCLHLVLLALATNMYATEILSQKILEQKISVDLQDVDIRSALKSIEETASVYFTYRPSIISEISTVSIKAEDERLDRVLENIFSPYSISYKVYGDNNLVLSIDPIELEEKIITGVITDNSGEALIGANVLVKGTSIGTTTDFNGAYTLNVPDDATTLVISYTGYEDMEVNIDGRSTINIVLSEGVSLEAITVLGSRGKPRTDVDRPVPIDVVSAKELQATGQPDIAQSLHYTAPSFSAVKFGINDLAPLVDPASLRGLSPDQTLLLVNGKRRHKVAFFSNNNGVGKGQLANDINSIPSAAVKRVEILRDGAAAQYGSDAIAGVMNMQLKDAREGGSIRLYTGAALTTPKWDDITNRGTPGENIYGDDPVRDGQTISASANFGTAWGDDGFVNTTLHFSHAEPTDRSGIYSHSSGWYTDEQVAAAGVASDEELQAVNGINPDGAILGTAENTNYGVFINAGKPMNDNWDFYGMAGFTKKNIVGGVFTRTPARTSRSALDIFPDGYNPEVPSTLTDYQITSGVRGELGDGWGLDISLGNSSNDVQLFARNTINPSLGSASPTRFYTGGLNVTQTVVNADVNKNFGNTSIAFGIESRGESFQQSEGQIESYISGPLATVPVFDSTGVQIGVDGFKDVGSSGREGFSARTDGEWRRNNTGVYLEAESDITEAFLVAAAVRFENYSDFGGDFSWKLASRYKITDKINARASVNRSFRAPGLAQYQYSNYSQISFDNDGNSVVEPILPIRDAAVQSAFGFENLSPETSFDIAAGLTAKLAENFTITVDAYQVDIEDRIMALGGINPGDFSEFDGTSFDEITIFTNAISTVTQGLDFVANYRHFIGEGHNMGVTLAANFNKTEVDEVTLPDGLSFLADDLTTANNDVVYLTNGAPRRKIIASFDYNMNAFGIILRATNFGEVSEPRIRDDEGNPQVMAAKTLIDLSLIARVTEDFSITLGANNLFDIYPDMLSASQVRQEVIYSRRVNQFGTTGRFINLAMNYNF